MSAASAAADPAVVDTKLNLRSGPGSAFNVIAVMPPGTKLEVQTCGEEWCRVALGRRTGYVKGAAPEWRRFIRVGRATPRARAEADADRSNDLAMAQRTVAQ